MEMMLEYVHNELVPKFMSSGPRVDSRSIWTYAKGSGFPHIHLPKVNRTAAIASVENVFGFCAHVIVKRQPGSETKHPRANGPLRDLVDGQPTTPPNEGRSAPLLNPRTGTCAWN